MRNAHRREVPETAEHPVADSTDLYTFVSPDQPDTVTLIANYGPPRIPLAGPGAVGFGDDVLYEIHVDNNGDGHADVTYQFRFQTRQQDDPDHRQFYSVTKVDGNGHARVLARSVPCSPASVGPLSIPDREGLAADTAFRLKSGEKVFAGKRADGLFVDLDALRPFQDLHLLGQRAFQAGEATGRADVHSIALQVPIEDLRAKASPVIGVWTTASHRQVRVLHGHSGDDVYVGPNTQVSRLGNPLFDDVIVPVARKSLWNSLPPTEDKNFAAFVEQPELARLLPVLYPGVFDNLELLNKTRTPRADLVAVLLTGIPEGLVDGFTNSTGDVRADMLRLNTGIPPSAEEHRLGVLGGDLAGYPNGRRLRDDVISIMLRAVAGATLALVDKHFTPDEAVGVTARGLGTADLTLPFLARFPYLGLPS
ncbi:DUF4331 domain-containing protein [Phytohabitans kaempferiae]|uniref:DUF4331 domain-containing protein n=1 Tax=Phytohabitans kaempferiae TaxID=1620943 RepID=A0ABV6M4C7_9ACTN